MILASAIFIWMFIESRRLSMRHFWIIILATFSIAIAFSAPLFLFLRERRLLEINKIEHQKILSGNYNKICSFYQGKKIIKLISKIKKLK